MQVYDNGVQRMRKISRVAQQKVFNHLVDRASTLHSGRRVQHQKSDFWALYWMRHLVEATYETFMLPVMKWAKWVPSSRDQLEEAEKRVMSYMKRSYKSQYVEVGRFGDNPNPCRIYTVHMQAENSDPNGTLPLVLIHGLGCGSAMWVMNYEELSKNRDVYSIDLLGFGRSSRPMLSEDAWIAEMQMVHSIEEWRSQMKLERFVLLGHSLGGFLASSYAIKHPTRVAHLILEDPWGFPEFQADRPLGKRMPSWGRVVQSALNHMNVLAGLRAIGPLGPAVLQTALTGAEQYFGHFISDHTVIPTYVYHCNVRRPTGEMLFKNLSIHFGWTKYPMVYRLVHIDPNVPITFIYGSMTFITKKPAYKIKEERQNSYVDIQVISDCGHNIHMEKPDEFNGIVRSTCDMADEEEKRYTGGPRDHNTTMVDYRD